MDETGHSKDERQKFVGMAGLIAPAANWEVFENKWKAVLGLPYIDVPYFHMTDFASRKKAYENWSEKKRRKVFGKLVITMECAHPMPFGAIIPMDVFRSLTKEHQDLFIDPYFLCFQSLVAASTVFLEAMEISDEEKIALIFSDQVEFRSRARHLYDVIGRIGLYTRRSTPPIFRDMRDAVPLQAADIVAYEMYKEFDRRLYRPDAKPRYGFERLEVMSRRNNQRAPMFRFFTKDDLVGMINRLERLEKLKSNIEEKIKEAS